MNEEDAARRETIGASLDRLMDTEQGRQAVEWLRDEAAKRVAAARRRCLYILETSYDPQSGYIPVLIIEDEAGYSPMRGSGTLAQPWFWGHDIEVAKRIADEANADLGLSRDDVLTIVASSMAAQNQIERFVNGSE